MTRASRVLRDKVSFSGKSLFGVGGRLEGEGRIWPPRAARFGSWARGAVRLLAFGWASASVVVVVIAGAVVGVVGGLLLACSCVPVMTLGAVSSRSLHFAASVAGVGMWTEDPGCEMTTALKVLAPEGGGPLWQCLDDRLWGSLIGVMERPRMITGHAVRWKGASRPSRLGPVAVGCGGCGAFACTSTSKHKRGPGCGHAECNGRGRCAQYCTALQASARLTKQSRSCRPRRLRSWPPQHTHSLSLAEELYA